MQSSLPAMDLPLLRLHVRTTAVLQRPIVQSFIFPEHYFHSPLRGPQQITELYPQPSTLSPLGIIDPEASNEYVSRQLLNKLGTELSDWDHSMISLGAETSARTAYWFPTRVGRVKEADYILGRKASKALTKSAETWLRHLASISTIQLERFLTNLQREGAIVCLFTILGSADESGSLKKVLFQPYGSRSGVQQMMKTNQSRYWCHRTMIILPS